VFATRYKPSPRLILLVTFGGTSTLNYAFGLAMGWLLDPGDYGLLAFAQAWLLVAGMVLSWGFASSLARAVAKATGPHKRDALVRGALLANFTVATTIGAILLALFAAGPLRGGFEGWPVAVIVALCLPFISLAATATGCAEGSERFGITAWLKLTEMSCKALSGVALVLLGLGAFGAIVGFLVGAVCVAVLGFRKLTHSIGVRLRGSLSVPDVGMSVAMFGALLGLSMLLNLDLVGLKLFSHDRALVGYYQAGVVLSNAPYYLAVSTMLPVLFVQLARYESVSATHKTLGETLGLTAVLILPLEIVLVAFPEQALTTVFPAVYAPGAPALRILAIGNTLLILAAIFSTPFQAVGRAKVPALILLTVVLVEPFALWAVVPTGQAVGAAWVFVAAAFLTLSCLIAVYLHETRAAYLRRVALWGIRYVLAVGMGLATGRLMLGLGVGTAVVMGGVCYLVVTMLLQLVRPPTPLLGNGTFLRKLGFYKEE
jgi:O-antigen/teichoic acid export membrane protein